jgi:hypothetical protein
VNASSKAGTFPRSPPNVLVAIARNMELLIPSTGDCICASIERGKPMTASDDLRLFLTATILWIAMKLCPPFLRHHIQTARDFIYDDYLSADIAEAINEQ